MVRGNGQIGPLALGLHAQMGAHLLKGDFQLPAQDKPFQDLGRVRRRVGAEQGLGSEGALGVSDQHPTNEHSRLAGAVPDHRLRGEFHRAGGAVIPGHCGAGPSYLGLVEDRFQLGTPCAFQRRAAVLTWLTGGRRCVEGGVQTQTGDESHRLAQGMATVEEIHTAYPLSPTSTRGRWGSQRRSCMTIWRAQLVIFLCRRPCCW